MCAHVTVVDGAERVQIWSIPMLGKQVILMHKSRLGQLSSMSTLLHSIMSAYGEKHCGHKQH
jgi:hypothetical protein